MPYLIAGLAAIAIIPLASMALIVIGLGGVSKQIGETEMEDDGGDES